MASVFYYWVYHWNYSEAKGALSLVMPSNMLVYAQEHDLTDEELAIRVGQIEEARKSLPLITAHLPIQFNVVDDMGRGNMFDKIPFTKPSQIYIDVFYGKGFPSMANNFSEYVPLPWNGSIVFDGGTQKSITGRGWDGQSLKWAGTALLWIIVRVPLLA